MNVKVKICGITTNEDAQAAVHEGATALGFIFVRSSPRSIEPDRAKEIIRLLPPFVTPVGVLTETSRPEALVLVAKSGIRCLQLQENKDSGDFADFPIPCYRVFRVSPEFKLESLRGSLAGAFMLDTFIEGILGGTGKTFDWNIAVQAKKYGRVILSGGINPENVGEAVRRVSPYAIDVSSGVERSPGVKDHRKMHLLFEAIAGAGNDVPSKGMAGR
jgi:phosphoribosylanthranilate isomerase